MKQRLVKEIRSALGWTPHTADTRMKLTPGTWALIESGQQAISVRQFIRLFSATFKAAFGTVALQTEELAAFQQELDKASDYITQIIDMPQNEKTAALAQKAKAAINQAYQLINKP